MQGLLQRPFMRTRPSYMPKYWPVPASCVLYLEGQQDAYSSTVKDLSGYNNHGTINGATWERNSQGLWTTKHDGTDDYITVTDAVELDGMANITIKIWMYVTTVAGGYKAVVVKPASYVLLTINAGLYGVFHGPEYNPTAAAGLTASKWHHFVGVCGAGSCALYIDGVEAGTDSGAAANITATANDLYFGEEPGQERDFPGNLALELILAEKWAVPQIVGNFNDERHLFGR